MLWLKTMGVTLVIAGCGSWGLKGARRIEKRVEQIKELRLAMNFLEKEISYMHTPLSRALNRTAHFSKVPVAYLFAESSRSLEENKGITGSEAWMTGIDKMRNNADLKEKDIELLATAAHQLGMSNANEQRKYFALIQEELSILEEKALQEAEAGRKIWSYGGFIIGAVVVLLLI